MSEVISIPDPFDPATLRLSQDFAADLSVKKALVTIPVKKPVKTWFVRTHPSEGYRLQTTVLELKEEGEVYVVAPDLRAERATESPFSVRVLYTAVNRQGVLFLWPIRLPGPDGRLDSWSLSAREAAQRAEKRWD